MEIKAPEFPESIADGEIAAWHVEVGQEVKRDQVLVDIETDKVVLEVVAPVDGVLLKILKEEGDTVLTEEVLAEFEAGEVVSLAPAAEDKPVVEAAKSETVNVASPAARKIAEENQIDVTNISGTGKGGRVTKEDILKAVAAAEQQTSVPSRSGDSESAMQPSVAVAGERVERRVPMTRFRASIALRLMECQRTAAMLTTFNEVDMRAIYDPTHRDQGAF